MVNLHKKRLSGYSYFFSSLSLSASVFTHAYLENFLCFCIAAIIDLLTGHVHAVRSRAKCSLVNGDNCCGLHYTFLVTTVNFRGAKYKSIY